MSVQQLSFSWMNTKGQRIQSLKKVMLFSALKKDSSVRRNSQCTTMLKKKKDYKIAFTNYLWVLKGKGKYIYYTGGVGDGEKGVFQNVNTVIL